jgi:DNA polymerase III subunit epsilon
LSLARRLLGSLWPGRPVLAEANETRWVVLDVETTGLDIHHDALLAVAAIAVQIDSAGPQRRMRLNLADSFEALVQHHTPVADKSNILLHGIGVESQRQAEPATLVLQRFTQWIGDSPLLAYHAAFDEAILKRALRESRLARWANPWLDLAPVARGLAGAEVGPSLDDWMTHFAIPCAQRHQAAADTMATTELLQHLWPLAQRRGLKCFADWSGLAQGQVWLDRRSSPSRL